MNKHFKQLNMNTFLKIFVAIFMIVQVSACNQDIDKFDNGENYIYFNMPFILNQYDQATTTRIDSISYSFALDDYTIHTHTFKIPVNTIGLMHPEDRNYTVEVVTDSSTATSTDWDIKALEQTIIKKGRLQDTLYITVNRTDALQTEWHHLVFRLLPNDQFKLGDKDLQTAKISFSDILQPPMWWGKWKAVFGEFCREKFVKWQEIYFLGADPNVETIGGPGKGKPLYWDNMPYYANAGWYPSTYMFIRILKQYFIEHEVYPNGDTSKVRIQLP